MCRRPGDSSLVISIFWMRESHKRSRTWESWILIGDWELIGSKSGGQVQCIFMFNFRGHIRVGRVIVSYHQYWSFFFFLLLHTYEPKAALPLSSRWPFLMSVKMQWTRVAFLIHSVNLEHISWINRHFCFLDVVEIECCICCLFSCVWGEDMMQLGY